MRLPISLILLMRFSIYLGVGFLTYAYYYGSAINWNDAWFYACLLAWPFILGIWFILWAGKWLLILAGLAVAGFLALIAHGEIQKYRRRRARERKTEELRAKAARDLAEHRARNPRMSRQDDVTDV